MNLIIKLLQFFQATTSNMPKSFGFFHIFFLVLVLAACILLCVFFRNSSDKVFRRISLIFWIVILVTEVFKQFSYMFVTDGTTIKFEYQLWAFPYQLCSTPFYVLPFCIFLKEGKVRDFFIKFVETFILLGGIIVMIYPNDVFNASIYINHQTMIHHGTQVILGVYYLCYNRKKLTLLSFWKALPIFGIGTLLAIGLNELFNVVCPGQYVNLWSISRLTPCTLPILGDVYKAVPYPVFILAYLVGFSILAFVINGIALGIYKLVTLKHDKKQGN